MTNNPFKNLYVKLTEKSDDAQAEFIRLRKLKIFMEIVESNPMMDVCALNFFRLSELNIIKILMRKTFREFLNHFTRKNLKHVTHIDYFIKKIYLRGKHFKPTNKILQKQWKRQKTMILIKLNKLRHYKKDNYDKILRKILRESGISQYWCWGNRTGNSKKWGGCSRREIDALNEYCLRLVQEGKQS